MSLWCEIYLCNTPSVCVDPWEMFVNRQETMFSSHTLYDCNFDLLSGVCPPQGKIYLPWGPETFTVEEYTWDCLTFGFIPLSLPAGAILSFVGYKDWGLSPFTEHHSQESPYHVHLLNSLTVALHSPDYTTGTTTALCVFKKGMKSICHNNKALKPFCHRGGDTLTELNHDL